ncbi:hypothetical protein HDU99_004311 [Rhizoclosmatium hyalinum]|nr:hypothetical protein HDU99_004311 [Rhizoclosmatium hyalinum]
MLTAFARAMDRERRPSSFVGPASTPLPVHGESGESDMAALNAFKTYADESLILEREKLDKTLAFQQAQLAQQLALEEKRLSFEKEKLEFERKKWEDEIQLRRQALEHNLVIPNLSPPSHFSVEAPAPVSRKITNVEEKRSTVPAEPPLPLPQAVPPQGTSTATKVVYELADVLLDEVAIAIVHVSDEYSRSVNCKKEFTFAEQHGIEIIPVVVGEHQANARNIPGPSSKKKSEKKWLDNWLGFNVSDKLWIDARNPQELDKKTEEVKDAIKKRMEEWIASNIVIVDENEAEAVAEKVGGYTDIVEALEAKDDAAVLVLLKDYKGDWTMESEDILLLAIPNVTILTLKELIVAGLKIDREDTYPLIAAIEAGSVTKLELLIDYGANVKAKDYGDFTALHKAAAVGTVEQCRILLKHGADLDAKDDDGFTPFALAIKLLNLECAKFLHCEGADLTVTDGWYQQNVLHMFSLFEKTSNGDTAASLAVVNGGLGIIQYLIEKDKSTAEFIDEKRGNLVVLASQHEDGNILNFLLASGIEFDLSVMDDKGRTCLINSIENKNFDAVKAIHKLAPSLFSSESHTTIAGAASGSFEILKFLLEETQSSIDLKERDEYGRTVFLRAAANGNVDIMKFLAERDVSLLSALNNDGETAVHLAVQSDSLDAVKFLVEQDNFQFDLLREDDSGATVMSEALENLEIMKYLHQQEPALLGKSSRAQNNLLLWAVEKTNENVEVIEFLLKNSQFNLHSTDDNMNVVAYAFEKRNFDTAKLLIEEDVTLLDFVGEGDSSILSTFINTSSNVEYLEYLLDKKEFNLSEVDPFGNTILSIAIEHGYRTEVLDYLVKKNPSFMYETLTHGITYLEFSILRGHSGAYEFFEELTHRAFTKSRDSLYGAICCAAYAQNDKLMSELASKDIKLTEKVKSLSENDPSLNPVFSTLFALSLLAKEFKLKHLSNLLSLAYCVFQDDLDALKLFYEKFKFELDPTVEYNGFTLIGGLVLSETLYSLYEDEKWEEMEHERVSKGKDDAESIESETNEAKNDAVDNVEVAQGTFFNTLDYVLSISPGYLISKTCGNYNCFYSVVGGFGCDLFDKNRIRLANKLLSLGADVNARVSSGAISTEREGFTPLLRACQKKLTGSIDYLLELDPAIAAVDFTAVDVTKSTALHLLAERTDLYLMNDQVQSYVSKLAERGVAINAINAKGKTAYDIAVELGDKRMAAEILKCGGLPASKVNAI